jgi:2-succinyl-5-enolpyruvyl-6-hydroxy-3-cyclohexene-1-carboxylate synthase
VLHDERSAGYVAIGIGRATGVPAAVITTSGTAATNLLPAIVEADIDHVPLIAMTADRPPELQGSGANQTIDQLRMFGGKVRCSLELGPPDPLIRPPQLLATIDRAYCASVGHAAGPVHINARFRKPLEPTGAVSLADVAGLENWAKGDTPWQLEMVASPRIADCQPLVDCLRHAARGLLIVGRLASPHDRQAAQRIITALDWPVFADLLSNVHPPVHLDVSCLDLVLAGGAVPLGGPDVVLHLGGGLISASVPAWLRRITPITVARVDPRPGRSDPESIVNLRLTASLESLASCLEGEVWPQSDLSRPLQRLQERALALVDSTLATGEGFAEQRVARAMSRAKSPLFAGNSMAIRYMQRYGGRRSDGSLVFGNRGASGIDGNVSTAAGLAVGLAGPVTALLGDWTLLYDAGALASVAQWPIDLRMVVINNRGGGIFHRLPIREHHAVLERFFIAPHHVDLCQLGAAYGIPARRLTGEDQLAATLEVPARGVELCEVITDGELCARAEEQLLASAASLVAEEPLPAGTAGLVAEETRG